MKLLIPPPIIFLFSIGLMSFFPLHFSFSFPPFLIGIVVILSGVISVVSLWAFWQAKTTIHPHHPQNTTALVKTSVYRFSRNPMYLSLAMLLFAWGMYLGNLWAFIGIIFFVLYLNVFQIRPEEEILENLFGEEYRCYKQRVRRWL